jgi:hypothetical protein
MSGIPPMSPPPKSAQLDRYAAASDVASPQKLDFGSPAPAAAAAAAAPAEPESITSKVLGMAGDLASGVAAGFIPPEMIVDAIEKSEAAIGKAVGLMPPAQKTQFKQVLQRIVTIIEQQGGSRGRRRKTHKSTKKHAGRTRRHA